MGVGAHVYAADFAVFQEAVADVDGRVVGKGGCLCWGVEVVEAEEWVAVARARIRRVRRAGWRSVFGDGDD